MYRLSQVYDTKYKANYPEERCDILYAKFKHVENDDFKRCINYLIATCKFPPLYNDFKEVMREAINRADHKLKDEQEKKMKNCFRCSNIGTVFLERTEVCPINGNERPVTYAYRCIRCPRGNIYNGPYIKPDPEAFNI